MKVAICYSGQLRHSRMLINTHIKNIFIPLIENEYEIDVYLYSDYFNTTRNRFNNENRYKWDISNINKEQFDYLQNKLSSYSKKITFQINNNRNYETYDYNQNIISQLEKFLNVLQMVNKDNYNFVIRLRPDIAIISKLDINLIVNKNNNNILYQNKELEYDGDIIQIFQYDYLEKIINNTKNKITYLKDNKISMPIYEFTLNDIFRSSSLNLIWIPNFAVRWYGNYAKYIEGIEMKYFEDWKNIEYGYNFDYKYIETLLEIRRNEKNILNMNLLNLDNNIIKNNKLLYISALNPDIISDNNLEYLKDIIGLIPCSGTATRMNGIPKFLLPCKEGNLINNTINLFKYNDINNIYISISKENEHFIKPLNEYDNDVKYIVKNTLTMSETVENMVKIKSRKYILIMPDTYFINSQNENNQKFRDLTKLNIMLNKFNIVVILWKIKDYQYGKLGQIDINDEKVINIKDKDPECRFPYSWGVIGWTYKVNYLINATTPHIGYIINSALEKNINVGYIISETEYFDCGTPNEYFTMIKNYT